MIPFKLHLGQVLSSVLREDINHLTPEKKKLLFTPFTLKGVSTDSRTARKGELFLAIKGEQFNGIDFLKQALDKQCIALVNDNDFKDKDKFKDDFNDELKKSSSSPLQTDLPIICVSDTIKAYGLLAKAYFDFISNASASSTTIAITGSAGKTTCKDFLAHLLSKQFKVFSTQKNFNNHIGVPNNIFRIDEPYDFYIFEIGMNHAGEIDWLSSLINPTVSIITNILPAHIGFFNAIEDIAKAKAEILNHLSTTGTTYLPEGIHYPFLKEQAKTRQIKHIETLKNNQFTIQSSINNPPLPRLSHRLISKEADLNDMPVKLTGKHNEVNLSIACQIALDQGLSRTHLIDGISSLKPTDSRFECVLDKPIIIDDAYNANPTSMEEAIEWCLKQPIPLKCLILGDIFELGDKEKLYHEKMGEKIINLTENYIVDSKVSLKTKLVTSEFKSTFILIGSAMKYAYEKAKNDLQTRDLKENSFEIHLFKDNESALKHLSEIHRTYDALKSLYFFKASNGMKFKTLIHNFTCSIT